MAKRKIVIALLLANPCPNNEIFIVSERSVNDSSFWQLRIFFFFFGCAAPLVGSQFPNQGSNTRPMAVKAGVLITEPPGNSLAAKNFNKHLTILQLYSFSRQTVKFFFTVFHSFLRGFSCGYCFPGGSMVKNPPANTGDSGVIPWSGRFTGEGNSNSLH